VHNSITAVEFLADKQLALGHLVPSTSPRTTPRFVIPKKSGKWRLLQDLWAINAVTSPTGPLQPGVPNPAMIPEDWPLFVIDLKDWVFTISVHPDDCAHFAFSLPSINNSKPMQQYRWVVLPQGMTNSPTICQVVMDAVLKEVQQSFNQIYLYHYMDDIVLAAETQNVLLTAFAKLE